MEAFFIIIIKSKFSSHHEVKTNEKARHILVLLEREFPIEFKLELLYVEAGNKTFHLEFIFTRIGSIRHPALDDDDDDEDAHRVNKETQNAAKKSMGRCSANRKMKRTSGDIEIPGGRGGAAARMEARRRS